MRIRAALTAAMVAAAIALSGLVSTASAQENGGGLLGSEPPQVTPKFKESPRTTRTVPVNADPGDAVGAPVEATHENNLTFTYSLSGRDASRFDVDPATGQIRLKEGVSLTLGDTYQVDLFATDSAEKAGYIIVDIEVTAAVYDTYDANQNGVIEQDEVTAAVRDYYAGRITRDRVIALIQQYFAG